MSVRLLITLLAATVVGVAMIAAGLRGRRINRHPLCRDCGFDLSAVLPAGITCPECGAGLRRPRAYRIGQRRRMYPLVGFGALAAAPAALGIGAVLFAAITGTNLNAYKPLGLLLFEGRRGDALRANAAGEELLARYTVGSLTDAQKERVVEAAFDVQGDPRRPWCEAWGSILDLARREELLDEDEMARYRRQSPVLEWHARPRVRAGGVLPIVVTLKEGRIGPSAQFLGAVTLESVDLDGRALRPPSGTPAFAWFDSAQQAHMGWVQLYGSGTPWARHVQGEAKVAIDVPPDIAPGTYWVKARIAVRMQNQDFSGGVMWNVAPKPDDPNVGVHERTLAVEVLATGTEDVEIIPASEELAEKLAAMLRPTQSWASTAGYGQSHVANQFSVEGLPVPVAHQVVWRAEGREWTLGTLTNGTSADLQIQSVYGPNGAGQRYVTGMVSGFKRRRVDVVLRPSVEAARLTTDLKRVYGGEIVIEDVEISWGDDGGTIQGTPGGWLGRLLFGG